MTNGKSRPEFSVSRDEYGTPHIRAGSLDALMWGLGYTFAGDRLWQLEYLRRRAQGTMAEVAGSRFAALDYVTRGLRLAELGAKLWQNQARGTLAHEQLPAFVAGINAHINEVRNARDRLPPEFRRLGIRPSPVEPEEILALIYLYAALLTRDAIQERLFRILQTARHLSPDKKSDPCAGEPAILRVATLDETGSPEIVPGVTLDEWLENPVACFPRLQNYFAVQNHATLRGPAVSKTGIGSNNWAVSRDRSSETGALFAGDPHLELTDPPFFYEVTLACPEFRFAGALLAGLPFGSVGFNGFVAWSSTNLGVDYCEFLREPAPEVARGFARQRFVRVRTLLRWKVPLFFKPILHSPHGWVIKMIRPSSRPGGLLNSIFLPQGEFRRPPRIALTLFWYGSLLTDFSVDFVYRMLSARNISEFRESLRDFALPPQNFVFADVNGAIGYQAAGRIPARLAAGVRLLWSATEFDSFPREFIPFESLPHLDSSEDSSGFIATANNPPASPNEKYVMPGIHAENYRAARIVSVLRSRPRLSVEDMMSLQADHLALRAKIFLPLLMRCLPEDRVAPQGKRLLDVLRQWDGRADVDAFAPIVFRVWMDELERMRAQRAKGCTDSAMVADLVGSDPGTTKEVRVTFDRATAQVQRLERLTGGRARWGNFHLVRRTHSLASLFKEFRMEPCPHGGDEGTVDPGPAARILTRRIPVWIQTHGAAYRFVAVLSHPPLLFSAMPGASPARSLHPNADRRRWEDYLNHRYRSLPFPS